MIDEMNATFSRIGKARYQAMARPAMHWANPVMEEGATVQALFWRRADILGMETCFVREMTANEWSVVARKHNRRVLRESDDRSGKTPKGAAPERWPLDKAERKYLRAALRPFKDRIEEIVLFRLRDDEMYLLIRFGRGETICFPTFDEGRMYNGMKIGKKYKPEELGLWKK